MLFIRCYSQSLTEPSTGRREEGDVMEVGMGGLGERVTAASLRDVELVSRGSPFPPVAINVQLRRKRPAILCICTIAAMQR